jgi:predicted O-methyltransferase YrrM
MNPFFEIKAYAKHLWQAGGKHSVHSPFVFDLLVKALSTEKEYYCFAEIENYREKLLKSDKKLIVQDFGAGSRVAKSNERKVSEIASSALQSKMCAQALFRSVAYYKPNSILELGTSLGITAAYLAKACTTVQVHTIEGSTEIAKEAEKLFKQMQVSNVTQYVGNFDDKLDKVLRAMGTVDFALIDGNHRREPTLQYFKKILPYCNSNSIIVLDDIHWSSEMNEAWQNIIGSNDVRLSIDFFHFGMLFFNEGVEKQHFILKLPG